MELGLSLGMGYGVGLGGREEEEEERSSGDPQLQLDLRPLGSTSRHSSSHLGFPWLQETVNLEASTHGFDVNRVPWAEGEEGASSPRGGEGEALERSSSRASDEDENSLSRKKLRLSKEQSAFLEESFKEHNTLNPKQKLALAKQLNLRPRQVEVWFQNRRARTKLKQTEVDCEYLKRCCETLTEENRRLQKELADLRALKTTHPFYMQLPATTLSMCPSCERVSTTTTTNAAAAAGGGAAASEHHKKPASFAALLAKPRLFPFVPHPAPPHQPSAAS